MTNIKIIREGLVTVKNKSNFAEKLAKKMGYKYIDLRLDK